MTTTSTMQQTIAPERAHCVAAEAAQTDHASRTSVLTVLRVALAASRVAGQAGPRGSVDVAAGFARSIGS